MLSHGIPQELEGIVSEWILEEGRSQGAASLGTVLFARYPLVN